MLVWRNTLKRMQLLTNPKIIQSAILKRSLCSFATLKEIKQKQKIQRSQKTPHINSLLSDQLQQLAKLTHYSTSVSFLQKSELEKSYDHLQYALTQAKAKFRESINLQMFLKNRISILQKILNKNEQFVASAEQIFFTCFSLKGQKSLQTLKHLHNYMTALIIYNQAKLNLIIEYLNEQNCHYLLKKSEYFVSLNQFFTTQQQEALSTISRIVSNTQSDTKTKYLVVNNLCWFKILMLTKYNLEIVPNDKYEECQAILDDLIACFISAEKSGDLNLNDTKQIQKNLLMTNILSQYLKNKKTPLTKINPNTLLVNSHSPVILMNISHIFYFLQKYDQASIFMKIALQTSIQLHEPYRLGLGLVLMAKISHRLKLPYENILLDIFKNMKVYSDAVVAESFITYSLFLFKQMRYYEAESYMIQAEKIKQRGKARIEVEGIILPDFNFDF